ncbi:MAG: sigma-54 dependent transcriptional regulator [Kiloniellales bacterium]|nr:sigma-54 dependent transcriptional regulator [Kiloniellales bacterium]
MDPRHLLFLESASRPAAAGGFCADDIFNAMSSAGWRVHVAPDAESAGGLLDEHPIDVGLAHLNSEPVEGLRDGMAALSQNDDHLPWVALMSTEARQDPGVRRFVWESFYDFHTLPPDVGRLLTTLGHAHGMAMMARSSTNPGPGDESEPQMVGVCTAMQTVFRSIRKLAAVDAPVLVTGESGTGKELAAKAIHERSRRSSGPFIAVNCAALPPSLIQSELFGYEKGAFTGAQKRKIGSIESANGGTLFLDEIGDLSPELQVNLLRFLEEGAIQRVGNPQEIPVNVRVIAATHVDMERATAEERFREDLYFRLNVLRLELPPLRARSEDIEVLAQYCFEMFRHETSNKVKGFSPAALQSMVAYDWPGNVREMINRVRRATVMCEGRLIKPADLGLVARSRPAKILTLEQAVAEAERDAVLRALERSQNLSQAARALGTSRPRLYRLMAKHGVRA